MSESTGRSPTHRNGLAVDRSWLDESRDTQVGSTQTCWLRFGLLGLRVEQLGESALDELILALSIEWCLAVTVDVPFGHDEQGHDPGPSGRHVDADAPAHAVTHHSTLAEAESVDERDDRPGVTLDPIRKVERLIAVSVAEEVDQE